MFSIKNLLRYPDMVGFSEDLEKGQISKAY